MDHVAYCPCCKGLNVLGGLVSWWAWTKSGMRGGHSQRLKKLAKTKTSLQSINSSHVSANTSTFLQVWSLLSCRPISRTSIWSLLRSGKNMTRTICVLASLAMTKQQTKCDCNKVTKHMLWWECFTHLTTGVAKFPAAVEVWGSWHGVANAGHADVGEGEVDDDEVGGRAQLLELHKHHQDHDIAR